MAGADPGLEPGEAEVSKSCCKRVAGVPCLSAQVAHATQHEDRNSILGVRYNRAAWTAK